MKNSKVKRSLFALLLVINLVTGLVLSPVSVMRAEAKTKLSVTVKVGSQKANKKTITMKKGSSKKIKLSIAPNKSRIKTKYKTDKTSIVSVSKTGKLKAKKTGTAKIIITLSGNHIRKTKVWFKVKVTGKSDSGKNTGTPVVLTVNGKTFQAVFYNNETAKALLKQMPMTLNMKELNGNEKYHYFDIEFPTNEKSPGKIEAGDIMMYGSDCLVTFYKSYSTSYQYTSVGKIKNASDFAEAVGRGNVKITFKKGK
ncbi:MAG: Ig-like domain-containing protein [Lachnospiraceae bacterium]|nr:Ig-like domain-containing protein [Lachnospiraceae bacterium]